MIGRFRPVVPFACHEGQYHALVALLDGSIAAKAFRRDGRLDVLLFTRLPAGEIWLKASCSFEAAR